MSYCDLGNGISLIDTGLMGEQLVACYLIQQGDQAAIIETGNYQTSSRIMACLADKGISVEQVKFVIVTHIHLDHAGGASSLLDQLPNARLVVHPSGAKHMIDPEKLINGATAVYGEQAFTDMYGTIHAIPEQRVLAMPDGESLMLGERQLTFIHTPGHAYHHLCIWDELDQCWFTGDTFGVCYPQMKLKPKPLLIPTTTPNQFNPEALKQSIQILLARKPQRVMLTHFGVLETSEPMQLQQWLHRQIDDYLAITRSVAGEITESDDLIPHLQAYYQTLVEQQGMAFQADELKHLLAMDLKLNAQGLFYWYQKQGN